MYDDKEEDFEKEEIEDFGTCEECKCELSYMPNPAWGVGYVCSSCAKELRGENEF